MEKMDAKCSLYFLCPFNEELKELDMLKMRLKDLEEKYNMLIFEVEKLSIQNALFKLKEAGV